MNYCSLEDAFQGTPGRAEDDAARQARKEERRKARRCKGPAATYLELDRAEPKDAVYSKDAAKDPDRQHLNPLPDVPAMNPQTGLTEHAPVTASPLYEPFQTEALSHHPHHVGSDKPEYHKDRLEEYSKSEVSQHYMTIPMNGGTMTKKNFFGANVPVEESFADYAPDAGDYRLQPDFTNAFQPATSNERANASAVLPIPSVSQSWKPITPSGAQTAFIEHLPPPGGRYYSQASSGNGRSLGGYGTKKALGTYSHATGKSLGDSGQERSMEDVMRKLDQLYARLEEMNHSTPEQLTSEMLMFISSGIFVLFLMDLMVKRGSSMRF